MRRRPVHVLVIVLVMIAVWWWKERGPGVGTHEGPRAESPGDASTRDDSALARAVREKRSKVWVEGEGRIVHLLKDDRDPPRHQRCLAEVLGGHTIKISHNIDLAPRVPWREGQTVRFRGRFEWNDLGGVVHWTHRDPGGRHEGGWLEVDGRRYR